MPPAHRTVHWGHFVASGGRAGVSGAAYALRMPSHSLAPDTALSIKIGAVMSRNEYTQEPGPVIDELYRVAGGRLDLLAAEVGGWIGFHEDQYTLTLATALRALPLDMADAIALGARRRGRPTHSTSGFARPIGVVDQP